MLSCGGLRYRKHTPPSPVLAHPVAYALHVVATPMCGRYHTSRYRWGCVRVFSQRQGNPHRPRTRVRYIQLSVKPVVAQSSDPFGSLVCSVVFRHRTVLDPLAPFVNVALASDTVNLDRLRARYGCPWQRPGCLRAMSNVLSVTPHHVSSVHLTAIVVLWALTLGASTDTDIVSEYVAEANLALGLHGMCKRKHRMLQSGCLTAALTAMCQLYQVMGTPVCSTFGQAS